MGVNIQNEDSITPFIILHLLKYNDTINWLYYIR